MGVNPKVQGRGSQERLRSDFFFFFFSSLIIHNVTLVAFRVQRVKFHGKGREYPHAAGHLYNLEDFDEECFPTDWHRVYDRLVDMCEVQYPLRLVSKVSGLQ